MREESLQNVAPLVLGSSKRAKEQQKWTGLESSRSVKRGGELEFGKLTVSWAVWHGAACVSHRFRAFPQGPASGGFAPAGSLHNAGSVILVAFIVTRFKLKFCGLFCQLQCCN